ncbi:MAG TPA: histidine phosphatase family protein [Miltoncostaea sp.]|nr:histidine phosphatase family protein [Miltoncostaea sp.]
MPDRVVIVRHGRTTYNELKRVNGDPSVDVQLSAAGMAQVSHLRARVAELPIDLGVRTRFPRTAVTLDILLAGRPVPRVVCPDLDDVRLGVMEGADVEAYRAFRLEGGQEAAPEGGESRMDALARYVRGFRRLLAVRASMPLVVTHDIPIRFVLNALEDADPLEGPVTAIENGVLYQLAASDLTLAVDRMQERLPPAAA